MNRLEELYHSFKTIYMIYWIIGGIIYTIGVWVFGYLFCYRNPPESLKNKFVNKITGGNAPTQKG